MNRKNEANSCMVSGQDFVLAHSRCVGQLEAAAKRDLVVVRSLDLWMILDALDSILGEVQTLRRATRGANGKKEQGRESGVPGLSPGTEVEDVPAVG